MVDAIVIGRLPCIGQYLLMTTTDLPFLQVLKLGTGSGTGTGTGTGTGSDGDSTWPLTDNSDSSTPAAFPASFAAAASASPSVTLGDVDVLNKCLRAVYELKRQQKQLERQMLDSLEAV